MLVEICEMTKSTYLILKYDENLFSINSSIILIVEEFFFIYIIVSLSSIFR